MKTNNDTLQNLINDLRQIEKNIGSFPSLRYLRENGFNNIDYRIREHGGMKVLRKLLNEPVVIKSRKRKWENFNDIVEIYKGLIKEIGHFPTKEDLIERGISGVITSILRHGGFYRLYESLGIIPPTKPKGYWNDLGNVYTEIDQYIEKFGRFPSINDLNTLGLSGMVKAVIEKHGGFIKIREKYDAPLNSVEYGYFSDFNNVIEVIELCKREIGHFPTITELDKFRPGIKAHILKYHVSYKEVRKKLNAPIIQKEPEYWKALENVTQAINKLIDVIGAFPSTNQIEKLGEIGLYQGIIKYHGGLVSLREKMGYRPKKKSNLEDQVKLILDAYVIENYYYDNRRKMLYDLFNIELRHPITKNFLEIDRYYPKYRVAIEVQGEQHEKEVNYFARKKGKNPEDYLKELKAVDEAKRRQCEKQGIILIEITDSMTKKDILSLIKEYLPIRIKPIKNEIEPIRNMEEEIIVELQRLQSKKDGIVRKEDIVRYNSTLYKNIRKFFISLDNARKAAGIKT